MTLGNVDGRISGNTLQNSSTSGSVLSVSGVMDIVSNVIDTSNSRCYSISNSFLGRLDSNTITNHSRGISISGGFANPCTTAIRYNNITNNNQGIYISDYAQPTIHYNDIFGSNNQTGIYCDMPSSSYEEVDARFNYWGETTTAEMSEGGNPKNIASIYDQYDDATKGFVNYGNFLNGDVAIPPSVPQNVRAYAANVDSDLSVTLYWNGVSAGDLKRYNIYRGTSPTNISIYDSVVTNTSENITYLDPSFAGTSTLPNLTYYYRITAQDQFNNESSYSTTLALPLLDRSQWYVSTSSGSDTTGHGTEAKPFKTITRAIEYADNGDAIQVAQGTYAENINYNGKNIAITGDGMWSTIIDGGGFDAVVKFENSETSDASLKHFTIQNGGFSGGDYPDYVGGGIRVESESSPTLSYLNIVSNNSTRVGGGIWLSSSNSVVSNCIIKDNYADSEGGGIAIGGENGPIIKNCLIADNYGRSGGGIFIEGNGNYVLTNLTIVNNSSFEGSGGGGLFASRLSNSVLVNSILWGNTMGELPNEIMVDAFNVNEGSVSSLTLYNSVVKGGTGGIVVEDGSTFNNQGVYSFDPQFLNAFQYIGDGTNNSYELNDNSPAISAGVNSFEFNGNSYTVENSGGILGVSTPTPENTVVDLGAFENENGVGDYTGSTYYADASRNYGNGSFENPFPSIQAAINAASNGNTVSVAAGTYYENINFSGKNITVSGADSSNTIIDGGQNGSAVVINNGESSDAVLQNFTITNGSGYVMQDGSSKGGGIFISGASPILENLLITNNTAVRGGGVLSQSGAMILRNSRIYSNHSPLDAGGGLWLEGNASPEIYHSIQNVLIHHNSALAMGGGVKLFDNYAELVNCQIKNNSASSGGGIYSWRSYPTIKNTFIENNIVNNGQGGGLYATQSQTNLINSSISNNESVDDFGGGIYSVAGNLSIIESLVQGNVTNTRGGAMHIEWDLYMFPILEYLIIMLVKKQEVLGFVAVLEQKFTIPQLPVMAQPNGPADGFHLNGGAGNLIVKNSILWNDGINEISFDESSDPWSLDIEYSTIKNGQDGIQNRGYSYVWGAGNLSNDPQLDTDYSLTSGSAAADAGNPHAYFYDCDGTRNDMGYQGGCGINVSSTNLDFGYVAIGDNRTKSITVHSNNAETSISSASFTDSQFNLNNTLPVAIDQYSHKKYRSIFLQLHLLVKVVYCLWIILILLLMKTPENLHWKDMELILVMASYWYLPRFLRYKRRLMLLVMETRFWLKKASTMKM